MDRDSLLHKLTLLVGVVMIVAGLALGGWSLAQLPDLLGIETPLVTAAIMPASPLASPRTAALASPLAAPAAAVAAIPDSALVIGLDPGLPASLTQAVTDVLLTQADVFTLTAGAPQVDVTLTWDATGAEPVYHTFFAAATRFDTIDLALRAMHIRRAWLGQSGSFTAIAVLDDSLPALTQLLGQPGSRVQTYPDMDELTHAVWQERDILALVPFDQLTPALAVYAVDGQTPVENSAKFNPTGYPLIATIYGRPAAGHAQELARLQDWLPSSNRNPDQLTVVAMTGVTALVRLTAEQMDERGSDWPAQVVGPELAAADITAISNEVPFVPDCETNTDRDNLVFCSKPEYMAALRASGADIIGLTGNHQNDYGLADALASLEIYDTAGLPVYGGGADKESAMAPLYITHNGNRLAFLGANSYGPPSAWATDYSPGSAPFDLAIMSATIRSIKEQHAADVVLTEMQYQESYDVTPLMDQQLDFGALARAGADIVTGVQSHVPQAVEFVDGRLVLYGLGNLYFDQMWTEETREGLIVKHTIYQGRHISTQLLPTLLYDYGQPRWPDAARRAAILAKVFSASDWE